MLLAVRRPARERGAWPWLWYRLAVRAQGEEEARELGAVAGRLLVRKVEKKRGRSDGDGGVGGCELGEDFGKIRLGIRLGG